MGIWHHAGATRGETSPAAHRGIWHSAGATKSWFLVLQLSCLCRISLICRELPLHSLRSFVNTLAVVFVGSSWFKGGEFLHKMAISVNNWRVLQKNRAFLVNWPDWSLCSQHLFKLNAVMSVHMCPSSSIAQFPWFPCALWSAFGLPWLPSFSHSASLCLPYLSPFYPRHNWGRRSLLMLVLALWHSLPQ